MSHPTSSRLCSGPYIITPVLHQACNAQALTSSLLCSGSNICSTYFKPVMIRPLHHQPSPISSLFCPGSYIKHFMLRLQHMFHPTSSLLSSGPYIMPVMLRPQHMSLWRLRTFYCSHLTYQVPPHAPEMLNTSHCSSAQACYVQAPTTSEAQHFHPASSLLCSGTYIFTPVLHEACYAQAPTSSLLCSGSNICSILHQGCYAQAPTSSPQSYIKPVMPRLLHQACYAPRTYVLSQIKPVMHRPLHHACYAQAPTHIPEAS